MAELLNRIIFTDDDFILPVSTIKTARKSTLTVRSPPRLLPPQKKNKREEKKHVERAIGPQGKAKRRHPPDFYCVGEFASPIPQ